MKTVTAIAAVALLIAGCAQTEPKFDPAVTSVQTIDGKKFNIPEGAKPSPHLATKKEIEFYKKSGVSDCKQGDVLWDARDAQAKIAKAIKEGNPNIHKELAQKGLIGCAHPVK